MVREEGGHAWRVSVDKDKPRGDSLDTKAPFAGDEDENYLETLLTKPHSAEALLK